MTNYSEHTASCRFSLFKPSGKWYMDHEVDMTDFYEHHLIQDAVKLAWARYRAEEEFHIEKDWILVVMEPYHIHAHPVMIRG